MSAALFVRLAQQCRELLSRARTELVKEQLRLWISEFEQQAAEVDEQQIRNQGRDHR